LRLLHLRAARQNFQIRAYHIQALFDYLQPGFVNRDAFLDIDEVPREDNEQNGAAHNGTGQT
jgi:hypothetical protein